jgi:predicted alpha/beta-hydrolase family hydrolase
MADETAERLFVFAHGAGAGMSHPFMLNLAARLADLKIATLRYNFPYMERGGKRPDPPAVAEKAVSRAIETAAARFPGVRLLAGGKSFGGRMTSQVLSKVRSLPAEGVVFVGFPLHPAGQPGSERARHLAEVEVPMLFLQGTRDALADIRLVREVCKKLPMATLKTFEGADHSFKVPKQDLIPALAEAIDSWSASLPA